jgi:hypothetical protein
VRLVGFIEKKFFLSCLRAVEREGVTRRVRGCNGEGSLLTR